MKKQLILLILCLIFSYILLMLGSFIICMHHRSPNNDIYFVDYPYPLGAILILQGLILNIYSLIVLLKRTFSIKKAIIKINNK